MTTHAAYPNTRAPSVYRKDSSVLLGARQLPRSENMTRMRLCEVHAKRWDLTLAWRLIR
jgi:hypothetical protein